MVIYMKTKKKSKGFIIGKFMPPHNGHLALFDKALEKVDSLTVMVFWKNHEPISGAQRITWLRELRPDINFLECNDDHAVNYSDPKLWDLWMNSIRKNYTDHPDIVFASEEYGEELARRLNADFFCFDKERKIIPVSASLIRGNPWLYWHHIPENIRPHFIQRIGIVGGESTGKTTLAAELAKHFDTDWVPEYAREFLSGNGNVCTAEDMPRIANEQLNRENVAQHTSNRFLFCDTNAIVTKLWSIHYFGQCSEEVESIVQSRSYSFYLVTRPDIPWVDDGLRDTPNGREWFYENAKAELERLKLPYAEVSGLGVDRLNTAINHINKYFKLT